MGITSPPIVSPCYYGIDTPRAAELIANGHSQDEIRKFLGVDTLHHLSLQGMLRAVGKGDESGWCTACFTRRYPTPLVLHPLARATPRLLRASCLGPLREGVVNTAFIVYVLVLPPAAAALVYLLAGRRRMTGRLRRMGDWCLALVLLISALNNGGLALRVAANWATLRPGLASLRAACWK